MFTVANEDNKHLMGLLIDHPYGQTSNDFFACTETDRQYEMLTLQVPDCVLAYS